MSSSAINSFCCVVLAYRQLRVVDMAIVPEICRAEPFVGAATITGRGLRDTTRMERYTGCA